MNFIFFLSIFLNNFYGKKFQLRIQNNLGLLGILISYFIFKFDVIFILCELSLKKFTFFQKFFCKINIFFLKLTVISFCTKMCIFILSFFFFFLNDIIFANDIFDSFHGYDYNSLVTHIQESGLYNSCKTTEDKALVIKYFTQPHYRCAIIGYVACYYSHFRPTSSLSYFFPVRFPGPQLSEFEYFDCCLRTLDIGTVREIVITAENNIPGFSEYGRPPTDYFINPVERQSGMCAGPVIPYGKVLAIMAVTIFVFLLTKLY